MSELEDQWQGELFAAPARLATSLKELHLSNPWPEHVALEHAMNTLATELWDRGFRLSEVRKAFEDAVADLPRYAAGQEVRR